MQSQTIDFTSPLCLGADWPDENEGGSKEDSEGIQNLSSLAENQVKNRDECGEETQS